MPKKNKNFSAEQHLEVGLELYEISQRLMYLGNKLHTTYNKKTANYAFEAHEQIVKLRSELDKHASRETDDGSGIYFKVRYLANS